LEKQTYQEMMWLFQEFGRTLRLVTAKAPSGDERRLLKFVIERHESRLTYGRNPFNWLKELYSTLNYWHHLQSDSDVLPDDIFRDLDTLERVVDYLCLERELLENVRAVKERIRVRHEIAPGPAPSEEDIRSWIRQEVASQVGDVLTKQGADSHMVETHTTSHRQPEEDRTQQRGEHADRVREFAIDTYIEPARAEGLRAVGVRAGDIDKALGYRYRRLPLICAALRSQKFLTQAHVKLVQESGPPGGASTTTTFHYELLPSAKR
jgi:hypothetical protein